ncbi:MULTISPECIES: hypothetical protein [Haloferacaceae]|uniref:Small CPxCG-related zinc finger protein n=2 Tax=Haloferacaceae TaxID=1644056 RepID=A0ABD6DD74_9EURY|nr:MULTISPECIES: hypothetical protein [Halorubraceae]
MTFSHIHREEARHVGDPDDASISELTGVAPPCKQCGEEPGTDTDRNGDPICPDCPND